MVEFGVWGLGLRVHRVEGFNLRDHAFKGSWRWTQYTCLPEFPEVRVLAPPIKDLSIISMAEAYA